MSRREAAHAARVEAEVRRRMDAFIDAQKLAPNESYADMTPEEIRAKAVAAVQGPEVIDGKEPDAIEAVFDHLLHERSGDPVRRSLASRLN